jgi:RNA polymerase sigma factor (sigma-70 family)
MEETDANLVVESLKGSREAFGHIVARYQTLLCSLAYSATGSFSQSQDLSQETFVIAWKQLAELREPGKLRAWLCAILKNRIYKTYRREGREPMYAAEPLENAQEITSAEPVPSAQAISKEEEAILWRSLERIPELYREPLVLFYREHQSIETVAANLDLTEDTVKQRLSRGRKLLQEQVLALVEGTLERTNPDKAFTMSVLAALPGMTISAKAAAIGAAAAKGSVAAKTAGIMGVLGAICSPLFIIVGNYSSYRMSMDEAQTDLERTNIKKVFGQSLMVAATLSVICAGLLYWILQVEHDNYLFWGMAFSQAIVIYFLTLLGFVIASIPGRRRYLSKILVENYGGQFPAAAYEYRSKLNLFGLPLVHVRIGDRFDLIRGPVKAWIAVGSSTSFGIIFASGGLAVAPISFGGTAIGILPFGAIALGVFPIGAIALGFWAFGAFCVAWQACCGSGVAWNALVGGLGVAHDYALGGKVFAAQANTDAARQFIQQSLFLRVGQFMSNHSVWIMLLSMLPVWIQSRIVANARRRREQGITATN